MCWKFLILTIVKFWGFRERPTTVSLDKIKRELITTTAREDGKFQRESAEIE
jgi:hypothetical protein